MLATAPVGQTRSTGYLWPVRFSLTTRVARTYQLKSPGQGRRVQGEECRRKDFVKVFAGASRLHQDGVPGVGGGPTVRKVLASQGI